MLVHSHWQQVLLYRMTRTSVSRLILLENHLCPNHGRVGTVVCWQYDAQTLRQWELCRHNTLHSPDMSWLTLTLITPSLTLTDHSQPLRWLQSSSMTSSSWQNDHPLGHISRQIENRVFTSSFTKLFILNKPHSVSGITDLVLLRKTYKTFCLALNSHH